MPKVRTRFAPSPTGYMHIGGMRTALFNWLWARHNGGTFILRIDDTDRQRNLDEALGPILHAFRWLGLGWDEGPEIGGPYEPYFQSQRDHLYAAAAEKLLASGKAYRDFDTQEQIQADRKAADQEKRPYINIRRSTELSPQQVEQYLAEGKPHVVRFLVPREEKVKIRDHVRGDVEWDCALITDPVIMRSDGSPLYNFATVVDDAQMQITHVVRAEEHLSNTPVQVLLHQALGHELPEFAHIPYVAAPGSKEKLSKRKLDQYKKNPQFKKMFEKADQVFPLLGIGGSEGLDPVMVEYYRQIGYLPQAVLNALARLGWSLDDKTEIMSLDTIVENFTLDRVVKNPAGLDPDKLYSFQSHWIGQLSLEEKIAGCAPYLQRAGFIANADDPETRRYVGEIITALGDRLKLFSDILDVRYLFTEEFEYDEKNFTKRVVKDGTPALLAEFKNRIAAIEDWTVPPLEAALQKFAEEKGVSPGVLIHALRLSTTGQAVGPGVYDCLVLVGKQRSLERINKALAMASS